MPGELCKPTITILQRTLKNCNGIGYVMQTEILRSLVRYVQRTFARTWCKALSSEYP